MPGRPHITGLLIDISGNLHVDSAPTPNAVEAFQRLVDSKIPFRLCSNTSKESSTSLEQRLTSMGFNLVAARRDRSDMQSQLPRARNDEEQLIWTSLGAVAQLLKEMDLKR
jgi:Haloacid dehalogenase-like hydrolase